MIGTSSVKAILPFFLIFILCSSQRTHFDNKNIENIAGVFTALDAISDRAADSLHCEGIKYELKIDKNTTYILTFSCADNTDKILTRESGRWKLADSLTLQLTSTNSQHWLVGIENSNRLVFLKKNKKKLTYSYRLYRDTVE